jgi:hypothetical protein
MGDRILGNTETKFIQPDVIYKWLIINYIQIHSNEGSIPFTRSIHNQSLTQKCK